MAGSSNLRILNKHFLITNFIDTIFACSDENACSVTEDPNRADVSDLSLSK